MVDRDTRTYHYPTADKLHHFCMDLGRTYLWLQSNAYNFNQEMTNFLSLSYTCWSRRFWSTSYRSMDVHNQETKQKFNSEELRIGRPRKTKIRHCKNSLSVEKSTIVMHALMTNPSRLKKTAQWASETPYVTPSLDKTKVHKIIKPIQLLKRL